MTKAQLLRACEVSKAYGGVRALRGVDFDVAGGEVHALVGENGAGKSTLVRVLAGLEVPDAGALRWRGTEVRFRGPHEALAQGVHLIPQELLPFRDMTVAENLFAGQEPAGWFPGTVDRGQMRRRAVELLGRVGFGIDPDRRMGDLTVAQMQGVEIARALAAEAELLILDEPTSALSARETERLFGVVEDLRRRGVGLVYISHKLEEIYRLADRVTVLRDGVKVGTARTSEVGPEQLIRLMVGRELTAGSRRPAARRGDDGLLEVKDLGYADDFSGVSFSLRRGEILGLAGLVGAGRTELASALYGLRPTSRGEIRMSGRPLRIRDPADALRAGIAMVTEDRQDTGLIGGMSVRENLMLSWRARGSGTWRIDRAYEERLVRRWMDAMRIKAADPGRGVLELSGGNQQKVVLARALMTEPRLLILDEPTRGIDVGAKAEIYELIRSLRDEGLGILLISSELPELLALCDRILVMCGGRLQAEFDARDATEELLLTHAMPRAGGGSNPPWREGDPMASAADAEARERGLRS